MNDTFSRLYLDDITTDHVDDLITIVSHPKFFYPYLNDDNKDPAVEVGKYFQLIETSRKSKTPHTWIKGIFNENHQIIGACDMMDAEPKYPDVPELGKVAEIGYFLKHEEQRKGIGAWAAKTFVEWCHAEHDICYLWGTADPDNKPSIAILENVLGLTKTGYIPQSKYKTRDGTAYRPRCKFEGLVKS